MRSNIPGVSKGALKLYVKDGFLRLRGSVATADRGEGRIFHLSERRPHSFSRDIWLPKPVIAERAEAERRDGILRVTIPKDHLANRDGLQVPLR